MEYNEKELWSWHDTKEIRGPAPDFELAFPVVSRHYGFMPTNVADACRYKSGEDALTHKTVARGKTFMAISSKKPLLYEFTIVSSQWSARFKKFIGARVLAYSGEAFLSKTTELRGTRTDDGHWVEESHKHDPMKPGGFKHILPQEELSDLRKRMVAEMTVLPENEIPHEWPAKGEVKLLKKASRESITVFFPKIAAFVELEILRERNNKQGTPS